MFSRDGLHFSRRYRKALLRPGPDGRNWNKHSIMIAWGLLPTAEGEISIYYGRNRPCSPLMTLCGNAPW